MNGGCSRDQEIVVSDRLTKGRELRPKACMNAGRREIKRKHRGIILQW